MQPVATIKVLFLPSMPMVVETGADGGWGWSCPVSEDATAPAKWKLKF